MQQARTTSFSITRFLSHAGQGRQMLRLGAKEPLFFQGEPADSIFYLLSGRAKLTVDPETGKQATITMLAPGDFIGEEAIAAADGCRLATATTLMACTVLKIQRDAMLRVMHEEHEFSDLFLTYLLSRSMRTQADLIDQLFNNSEKRLARVLLLMAEFGEPGESETLIPNITQESLADMIGTTRSRASFFMNRFRKMGFIKYNGRIRVHTSLLNVVLHN